MQDANECWTEVVRCLQQEVDVPQELSKVSWWTAAVICDKGVLDVNLKVKNKNCLDEQSVENRKTYAF